MTLHWMDLALIGFAVIAGCAVTYFALLRAMSRVFSERDSRIADELAALGDAVGSLETRMNAHANALERQQQDSETIPAEARQESASPRIRAAIAAAATAFLGRSAAVRAIKTASSDAANPWSQQGRMLVQTSHNLPSRR